MPEVNGEDVRAVLLEVIREQTPDNPREQNLQSGTVLRAAAERLGVRGDLLNEQVLLTEWHELFRTGYLAWGLNLANPNPPFFHTTERGGQAIEWLNRDPSNPSGYLGHLYAVARLNAVADTYLVEALSCYGAGAYKGAAVMLGGASESVVLEMKDVALERIAKLGDEPPRGLQDWKIHTIMNALKGYLDSVKREFPRDLAEEYQAYWAAFSQQIRAVRNEAGHPSSIEPITPDAVRASFLVFPEIAALAYRVRAWLEGD